MSVFPHRGSASVPDPAGSPGRPLRDDLEAVEQASAALDAARRGKCCPDGSSQPSVRGRCQDLSRALDAAVASATAAWRTARGPLEQLSHTQAIAARNRPDVVASRRVLDDLRLARQRHHLAVGPACGAAHHDGGQAFAADAVGAVWPVSDYQVEDVIYRTKTLLPPVEV